MTAKATDPVADADTQPRIVRPLVALTHVQRVALFGHIAFTADPQPSEPDHVHISDVWRHANLTTVHVPQLARNVTVHRLVATQFLALWAAWEAAGLLSRVLKFNGAQVSRFKRGHATSGERDLSNHAWGTAFDVNAQWNPLGHEPAQLGELGCVRELVPIAEELGWFWGGNFHSRRDGMHFEIARVIA